MFIIVHFEHVCGIHQKILCVHCIYDACNSCQDLNGVHEMHGRMHPN